jgi:hypothetical protein
MTDHYHALGLDQGATAAQIKAAYRRLAQEHHPDHGGDADTFQEISDAYAVLSDDARRQEYDSHYVDAAVLLDEVRAVLAQFVIFSSDHAAVACTLYAAVSYAAPRLDVAPRLVIRSPVPRCGKTRLLELLTLLVNRPEQAGNISPAALVHLIDEADPPTFLLDESDITFGSKRGTDDKADYLRQVLNLGYRRGFPYRRYNPATRKVEDCPTFAMAVLASIKDLPDTIMDRAVIIPMRRKAPGERVTRFRQRIHPPVIRELAVRLSDWAMKMSRDIGEAWPHLPDELNDRAQDTWEPLFSVADLAGGDWPAAARRAAIVLAAEPSVDKGQSIRLLADLRVVFGDADRLATMDIIKALKALDESPWADPAHEITPHTLSSLLEEFGIHPKPMRFPYGLLRGYERAPLEDAWARYLPDHGAFRGGDRNDRNNVTPQVSELPFSPVTDESVTGENGQGPDQGSYVVTPVTDRVSEMHAAGVKGSEISRALGISEAKVSRLIKAGCTIHDHGRKAKSWPAK